MVVAEKLYNKLCESYTQLLRMSYHQAQARTVGLLCTSAALKRGEDCKGLSCQGMKELVNVRILNPEIYTPPRFM